MNEGIQLIKNLANLRDMTCLTFQPSLIENTSCTSFANVAVLYVDSLVVLLGRPTDRPCMHATTLFGKNFPEITSSSRESVLALACVNQQRAKANKRGSGLSCGEPRLPSERVSPSTSPFGAHSLTHSMMATTSAATHLITASSVGRALSAFCDTRSVG